MGTNYYAEWNVSPASGGPVSLKSPHVIVEMHICKSLASFQGSVFNSWSAWRNFLKSNEYRVVIRDEYGVEHDIDEFIREVEAVPAERRSRQYEWGLQHGYHEPDDPRDWADEDGYSFHRGEFS